MVQGIKSQLCFFTYESVEAEGWLVRYVYGKCEREDVCVSFQQVFQDEKIKLKSREDLSQ